jgi:hypothetical protein
MGGGGPRPSCGKAPRGLHGLSWAVPSAQGARRNLQPVGTTRNGAPEKRGGLGRGIGGGTDLGPARGSNPVLGMPDKLAPLPGVPALTNVSGWVKLGSFVAIDHARAAGGQRLPWAWRLKHNAWWVRYVLAQGRLNRGVARVDVVRIENTRGRAATR